MVCDICRCTRAPYPVSLPPEAHCRTPAWIKTVNAVKSEAALDKKCLSWCRLFSLMLLTVGNCGYGEIFPFRSHWHVHRQAPAASAGAAVPQRRGRTISAYIAFIVKMWSVLNLRLTQSYTLLSWFATLFEKSFSHIPPLSSPWNMSPSSYAICLSP